MGGRGGSGTGKSGGGADDGWIENKDIFGTSLIKEGAVLYDPSIGTAGVGMAKAQITKSYSDGLYIVNMTKDGKYLHQETGIKTISEAKKVAEKMLTNGYNEFKNAENYIRKNGKEMVSKYPGKDIYGNSIAKGDSIIYSSLGIIKK